MNYDGNGDLHFSQIHELILLDKSTKGNYLSSTSVKTDMAYLRSFFSISWYYDIRQIVYEWNQIWSTSFGKALCNIKGTWDTVFFFSCLIFSVEKRSRYFICTYLVVLIKSKYNIKHFVLHHVEKKENYVLKYPFCNLSMETSNQLCLCGLWTSLKRHFAISYLSKY